MDNEKNLKHSPRMWQVYMLMYGTYLHTAAMKMHCRYPMSPPQMCLARRQWQALQMITATLSTLGHSVSFWSVWPFWGGLCDDLSSALVSTWKNPSSTWLTPRALLPAAHKIYNGHYAADLPDAWPNIFRIKNEYVVANHRQWCLPAASCLWQGVEIKKRKGKENRKKKEQDRKEKESQRSNKEKEEIGDTRWRRRGKWKEMMRARTVGIRNWVHSPIRSLGILSQR